MGQFEDLMKAKYPTLELDEFMSYPEKEMMEMEPGDKCRIIGKDVQPGNVNQYWYANPVPLSASEGGSSELETEVPSGAPSGTEFDPVAIEYPPLNPMGYVMEIVTVWIDAEEDDEV